MGIRNRQIGQSTESNLWYEVLSLVRKLRCALCPTPPPPPTPTTTSSSSTQACLPIVERSFNFSIDDDYAIFELGWDTPGALPAITVDWGDGSPVQVITDPTFGTFFNEFKVYPTSEPRTITVSYDICEEYDSIQYYSLWLRGDNNVTAVDTNNINVSQLLVTTKGTSLSLNIDNCTKLEWLNINDDYGLAEPNITVINTLDLSMTNNLTLAWIWKCTINTLILPTSAPLLDTWLYDVLPLDAAVNDLIILADSSGGVNGQFRFQLSGTLSVAGDAARTSLQGKGWTVIPPF